MSKKSHEEFSSQSENEDKIFVPSSYNSDEEKKENSENFSVENKSPEKSDKYYSEDEIKSEDEAIDKNKQKKFKDENLRIINEESFYVIDSIKKNIIDDSSLSKKSELNQNKNLNKTNSVISKKSYSIINQINNELDDIDIDKISKKKSRRPSVNYIKPPKEKVKEEEFFQKSQANVKDKNNRNIYENAKRNVENDDFRERLNSKNSGNSKINNNQNPFDNNLFKNKPFKEQFEKEIRNQDNFKNKYNSKNNNEAYTYKPQNINNSNKKQFNPYDNQFGIKMNNIYNYESTDGKKTSQINFTSKNTNPSDNLNIKVTKNNIKENDSLHDSMISKKEEYEQYLNSISNTQSKENFKSLKDENKFLRDENYYGNNQKNLNKLKTVDDLYKYKKKPLIYNKMEKKENDEFFYENKINNYFKKDLSARNDFSNIQNKNFEDSKREDSLFEYDLNKEKGINKAIDILLENDDI